MIEAACNDLFFRFELCSPRAAGRYGVGLDGGRGQWRLQLGRQFLLVLGRATAASSAAGALSNASSDTSWRQQSAAGVTTRGSDNSAAAAAAATIPTRSASAATAAAALGEAASICNHGQIRPKAQFAGYHRLGGECERAQIHSLLSAGERHAAHRNRPWFPTIAAPICVGSDAWTLTPALSAYRFLHHRATSRCTHDSSK